MKKVRNILIGMMAMAIPMVAMGTWDSVSSERGSAAGVLSDNHQHTLAILFYPQRECMPIMTVTTEVEDMTNEEMNIVSTPLVVDVDGEIWMSAKTARDVSGGVLRYSIIDLPPSALASLAVGKSARIYVGKIDDAFNLEGSKDAIFQAIDKCLGMGVEVPQQKTPTFHKPRAYTIL
jgi:hypothetical protein